jgi:serine/threonine protein kinase
LDRITFLHHLRQSRLLSDDGLAGAALRLPATEPAHALASDLVAAGILTPYQAREVWEGRGERLVLGQYRVLDELGKGGFGHVYKAVHSLMGRVVALKVIAPNLVEDPRARAWFRREVLAVTQLAHPNIVMAYDANEVDGALFLVMEFVDGESLDSLVRRQGPVPVPLACEMTRQAAAALQFAHERGMVHRDVKPANLLVSRSGPTLVKVVDFGLARLCGGAGGATLAGQTGGFFGTPDYVSPEQARDVHAADIRSDLYSLGCTLYFALTGQRPFRGETPIATIFKHIQEEPEPIESLRPDVPPELGDAVYRLMAKHPRDRFQTPAELVAALAPLCGGHGESLAAYLCRTSQTPAPKGTNSEGMPATAVVPAPAFWTPPESPPEQAPEPAASQAPAPSAAAPADATVPVEEPASPPPPAPAVTSGPVRIGSTLRRAWERWLAMIEAVAPRGGRAGLNEAAYRAAHAELLRACRVEMQACDDTALPVLRRLEATAEPWVTGHALASLDPASRASLVESCRALDLRLGGRRRAAGPGAWAVAAAVLFALAAGVLYATHARTAGAQLSVSSLTHHIQSNPTVGTVLLLPAVVLGTVYAVSRFFRA